MNKVLSSFFCNGIRNFGKICKTTGRNSVASKSESAVFKACHSQELGFS